MTTTQQAIDELHAVAGARDKYLLQRRQARGRHRKPATIAVGRVGLALRNSRIPGMHLPGSATRDAWHNKDRARA